MHKYLFLSILLTVGSGVSAQHADSVRIAAIPRGLFWENSPLNFSINKNQIIIVAGEKTDMFRDPNVTYNTDNAPKLLFEGDENFVLTASIEHAFASKWDGGAIIIREDSLHWIKFCFEKDYTGAKRVVSVVTKGISDDCNSEKMISDKVFYKVAKAGNVITLYSSANGKNWFLVRHLQFDNKGFKLGFCAITYRLPLRGEIFRHSLQSRKDKRSLCRRMKFYFSLSQTLPSRPALSEPG
jgi:regulation of enolase protein 1 (concanavalin A-like superfamily)